MTRKLKLLTALLATLSLAAPGSALGYGAQDVYLTGSINAAVNPWQQSTIEPDSDFKTVNAALYASSGMGGLAYSN